MTTSPEPFEATDKYGDVWRRNSVGLYYVTRDRDGTDLGTRYDWGEDNIPYATLERDDGPMRDLKYDDEPADKPAPRCPSTLTASPGGTVHVCCMDAWHDDQHISTEGITWFLGDDPEALDAANNHGQGPESGDRVRVTFEAIYQRTYAGGDYGLTRLDTNNGTALVPDNAEITVIERAAPEAPAVPDEPFGDVIVHDPVLGDDDERDELWTQGMFDAKYYNTGEGLTWTELWNRFVVDEGKAVYKAVEVRSHERGAVIGGE